MAEEQAGEERLDPQEARKLIGKNEATVVDISTDDEWERVGNIPGALRVSEDEVESRLGETDDDRKLIVVDLEGERSAEVAERLRENGRDAASIEGGLLAWEDEKLPLQPSADPALPGDEGSVEDEIATSDRTDEDEQPASGEEATTADQPPSSDESPTPRSEG